MPRISILTAFLNEADNLPAFRDRVERVMKGLGESDYEVILIDDHSSDGSTEIARRWTAADSRVRYIRLARNCGSHAAFSAGLARCSGDCAVLLAADLQDPPESIPMLLDKRREGFDVVWATRERREGESLLTRFNARVYYWLMRKLALPQMPATGADFVLLDRKVIDAYNGVREKNTSFLAMILWLGFRQTFVGYVKQARNAGRSKWSFSKKVKLWVDSLVSFSYVPIRAISIAGIMVSFLGMLYAAIIVVNALRGIAVEGWASLMLTVLLLGGFQLTMLGVLGEYIWRTYDESRGRPRYVVEEELGGKPTATSYSKAS